MSREEAIKKLKNLVPKNVKMVDGRLKGGFPDWNSEEGKALEMAIADMEKQIPKKPLDIVTEDNEFICMICPSCQEIAVEFDDKYCRRCGQALDWSEENE